MKKLIIISLFAFTALIANAQGNFPPPDGNISYRSPDGKVNATYHYVRDGAYIRLYKSTNVLTDQYEMFQDGSLIPEAWARGRVNIFDLPDNFRENIRQNAYNNIPSDLRNKVKGYELSIQMRFDSQTGRVREVKFSFDAVENKFTQLPIAFYGNLERWIRDNVWIMPTENGKQLNFISLNWFDKPNP